MNAERSSQFPLREALILDVLQKVAIQLGLDLDLQGFGGAEAEIIEYASPRQMGCSLLVAFASHHLLSRILRPLGHDFQTLFGDQ